MFNIDGRLMKLMNWITRFLYLQLLWVLFSLLGLVIVGLFPATFAMFGITRKWVRGESNFSMYHEFKSMFKEAIIKANILGWFIVLLFYSLYFYFNWLNELDGVFATVLLGAIIVFGLVFLFITIFIIPVYVHFNVGLIDVIKHALIMALSYPFHAIGVILIILVSWYFFVFFTIIFLFLGFSIVSFMIMILMNFAFNNIEKKTKLESEK